MTTENETEEEVKLNASMRQIPIKVKEEMNNSIAEAQKHEWRGTQRQTETSTNTGHKNTVNTVTQSRHLNYIQETKSCQFS